jgi:hypothetical protein
VLDRRFEVSAEHLAIASRFDTLVAGPFHRCPSEPGLIARLGLAFHFLEALVPADGGNLMRRASGVSEPGQRRLAQAVKDAVLRQPGGITPSPELIAEVIRVVTLAASSAR